MNPHWHARSRLIGLNLIRGILQKHWTCVRRQQRVSRRRIRDNGDREVTKAIMNIRANISFAATVVAFAYCAFTSTWAADDPTTKDEVVAMVQKAVAAIKSMGAEKAYAEFDDKSGQFVRGDFYISVIGLDGKLLAYGADSHHVGDNVMAIKDGDGREIIKERVQLAQKQQSFWQSYKFMNPVTKTVEPKAMYCERLRSEERRVGK